MRKATVFVALLLLACLLVASPPFADCANTRKSVSPAGLFAGKSSGRCGPFTGSDAVEESKEVLSNESSGLDVVVCKKHLRDYRTQLIHTEVGGVNVAFPVFVDSKPSTPPDADRSSSSKSSSDSSPAVSSSSSSATPVQAVVGFIARLLQNPSPTRRHRKLLQDVEAADVPTDEDVATVNDFLDEFTEDNPGIVSSRDAITASSLRRGTLAGEIFFAVYILTADPDSTEARLAALSIFSSPIGEAQVSEPQPCSGDFGDDIAFGAEENLNTQLASPPPSDCSVLLVQIAVPPAVPDSSPDATTTPTGTPPPPSFMNYESPSRNCIDPDGVTVDCEKEGVSFTVVDGDGASVRSGAKNNLDSTYFAEQMDSDMVGFYSTRPLYLVDPGYPSSNEGVEINEEQWIRVKLGDGLVSSSNRPATTVTCPVSQLITYAQGGDMQSPPKNNSFSVSSDYEYRNSLVLTIYPSGDVWLDSYIESSEYNYALEWACHWPLATASTTQSVSLDWTAPSSTSFIEFESSSKSCVEPGKSYVNCDLYGTDYTIVSTSSMTATLVTMGDIVGFYSSQPVYLVDVDYPNENDGADLGTGWLRVSMGMGLIPAAMRPASIVSCTGIQLATYSQEADLVTPAKNNLFTAADYDFPNSMIITIYPDGNVWVDASSYDDDGSNLVWEWACQWPVATATDTQTIALTWAAPTAIGFKEHESAEKSCFDHDGGDLCDAEYGTDFIAVLGDGTTSTTGKLVQDGGFTGFYSSQPVYLVDAGFPGSNNGVKEDGIAKVSLGTIPQAYRPLTSTTCVANFQSTDTFQYVSLQATPKENFYNSGGHEIPYTPTGAFGRSFNSLMTTRIT